MSGHSILSSQPPIGGHLDSLQNGILYTNSPPMSSHLRLKATSPVSQGWLLIAGSTVLDTCRINLSRIYEKYHTSTQNTPRLMQ